MFGPKKKSEEQITCLPRSASFAAIEQDQADRNEELCKKYNVEYDIVRSDYQRCTYSYQSEMDRARDYECSGGGFWGGVACGMTRNRIKSKAKDRLANCEKKMRNTPQFLENKIYSNYSYTVTNFEIKKEAKLKAVLINLKSGKYK